MISEGRLLCPIPVNRNVINGRAINTTAATTASGQYASQAGAADAASLDGAGLRGIGAARTVVACGETGIAKGSESASGIASTSKIDGLDRLLTASCSPICSLLIACATSLLT